MTRTSRIIVALAAVLLLALPGPALAQRVEGDRAAAVGIYQAEVQVRSQGEADRRAGFARALGEVFSKLTGDRNASDRPGVGDALRQAGAYVDSFDYRQDEGVSPSTGAPIYTTTLIVRFDQDKVDDIAAALGWQRRDAWTPADGFFARSFSPTSS